MNMSMQSLTVHTIVAAEENLIGRGFAIERAL
jgi:hypothetical protein